MTESKQKNRRYRGAKFSEYRLKNLVTCFAKDMSVKDTAEQTKFSQTTVRDIFMRLRKHIYTYGFMRVSNREEGGFMPARIIFAKKHRGVPEKYAPLFECEILHRIYFTKNGRGVKIYNANNAKHMEAVKTCLNYNKTNRKYDLVENLGKNPDGSDNTRPFDIADYQSSSTIIVNEFNLQPDQAFFRYLWQLLLKRPL